MEIVTNSSNKTFLLGEKIAKNLTSPDVIAFFGGMGAGKTTIIGGIASGLGYKGPVQSPTFNIVNHYKGQKNIYHFDMYRVKSEEDLLSTGFYDYLDDQNGIVLIEWSENISDLILPEYKKITIKAEGEDTRKFILENFDENIST